MIYVAMYEVSVSWKFSAAHAIVLPDGQREKPHKHRWTATATFRSDRLNPPGELVVDFVWALKLGKSVTRDLSEQYNDKAIRCSAVSLSAERLAELIAKKLIERMGQGERLFSVSVTESPGCRATYYISRAD